uniref:Phosphatidylserine synthase n=1 Tax=Clastoptera arizonana TaxID=38151 RepID=A0A1B6C6S3_9HEMI
MKKTGVITKTYTDPTDPHRVNERPVDDISLEFFYKPHTVTLFAVSIIAIVYFSFIRDENNVDDNIRKGLFSIVFCFVIISVLAFPNGPFTRPHPAIWSIVFGLSVLYLMVLVFLLFQNHKTVMTMIYWLYPELENFHIDMDREYGVNCSVITFENIWGHVDIFATAHFLGWAFKALLVRHLGILWAVSVMWEVTEIAFAHLLPNFIECWWDALILDVLLCNGLGIWLGLKVCKMLEMREYKWVSIRDIHSTTGKLKRAVLQFTPGSWTHVRWMDPSTSTHKRFFAICLLVIFWQVCELNTFFLKHIFEMPPAHPLVIYRLLFIGIVVAPSVRQYYSFISDPECKRVGSQCWVYGAIMATEALLCIKNGWELFSHTQALNIICWLLIIFMLSCLCVYGCVLWHKYFQTNDEFSRESSPSKSPNSKASLTHSVPTDDTKAKKSLFFEPSELFENLKRRQTNSPNGLDKNDS